MKKDWEIKKLGDICEFRRGLTYSKNDEVENSSNAVLRSNNIDLITNQLDLSEIKYISDKIKIDETKKVKRNSLLICTANGSKAHLGKVAFIDDDYDFAFGGFMGLLIPSESIYPRFFYYALISENYKKFIKSLSDGANINNLKFQDLSNFEIPVPPHEEQKRIVKILDEKIAQLETIKTNAKTNLQNANDLFQSQLTKAFSNTTWEKKRFSELFKLSSGDYLNSKSIIKGEYPIYGGNGIIDYHKEYNLTGDNIIIGRVGALCGNVRYISEPIWLTDNAFKLSFIDFNYDYSFITYLLNHINLRSFARQAAQPVISNSSLKDIEIPLPPLPEQKRIVEELDTLSEKVKALQNIYEQMLLDCEELKQSFLCKAFAGEL